MKIRKGFVSNSSSSSFILCIDNDGSKKLPKNIIKEFVEDFPSSDDIDWMKPKDTNWLIDKMHLAFIPLIDPKIFDKYRYFYSEDDFDVFLDTIGVITASNRGNKKQRYEYKKLWKKLIKHNKQAFFIVVGQDAWGLNNNGASPGDYLEQVFKMYLDQKEQKFELKLYRDR